MIDVDDMEGLSAVMHQGNIAPQEFWPETGVSIEAITHVAMCATLAAKMNGYEVPIEVIIAAMQGGAVLALNGQAHRNETKMEI